MVYYIASNTVNPGGREKYDGYIERVAAIVEGHGGRYVVRSEKISVYSGNWKPDRLIVIAFETRQQLENCFSSPEYQEIKKMRAGAVTGNSIVVED